VIYVYEVIRLIGAETFRGVWLVALVVEAATIVATRIWIAAF
tara:strand:+ start:234 stop:359 length:126 start_codon:yes stop_codon:yes gene_type:complete